jgi:hypothetical protein
LVVFDIFDSVKGEYLPHDYVVGKCVEFGISIVPVLYRGPFDFKQIETMIEANSIFSNVPGHVTEGCVIKPVIERLDNKGNRVILKMHSQRFLLMKDG